MHAFRSTLLFLAFALLTPLAKSATSQPPLPATSAQARWDALVPLFRERNILMGCDAVGANLQHAENPGRALQALLIWRLSYFWQLELMKWEKDTGGLTGLIDDRRPKPPSLLELISEIPALANSPARNFAERVQKQILANTTMPAVNNSRAWLEFYKAAAGDTGTWLQKVDSISLSPEEAAPFFDMPSPTLRKLTCTIVNTAINNSVGRPSGEWRAYFSRYPNFFYMGNLKVKVSPPSALAVEQRKNFSPAILVHQLHGVDDPDEYKSIIGFVIAHELSHYLAPLRYSAQGVPTRPYELSHISGLPVQELNSFNSNGAFSITDTLEESDEELADAEALFLSCRASQSFSSVAVQKYILDRANDWNLTPYSLAKETDGWVGGAVRKAKQIQEKYPPAETRVNRLKALQPELCSCPLLRVTSANEHRLAFKLPDRTFRGDLIPAEVTMEKPLSGSEYLWIGYPEDMGAGADSRFIAKFIPRGNNSPGNNSNAASTPTSRLLGAGLRFRGSPVATMPIPSAGIRLAAAVVDAETCSVSSYNESKPIHVGGPSLTADQLPAGTKLPQVAPFKFISPQSTVKHKVESFSLRPPRVAAMARSPSTPGSYLSSLRIYSSVGDRRFPVAAILGSSRLAKDPYLSVTFGTPLSEITVCPTHSDNRAWTMDCSNP